jgi:cell wall-associated NlpC family hydrolase
VQYRKATSAPAEQCRQRQALQAVAMSPKQSSDVLSRAVNVLGTPYVWGGSSPKKGFDCSGLVKYAFNDVADVDLPRTSNAMAQGQGVKVAKGDLKPGDLIFFNIKSRRVNHVAIYLGNDRFIHAPRRQAGEHRHLRSLTGRSITSWPRVLPKDQQALALASAKPSIAGLAPRFRSNRQQR